MNFAFCLLKARAKFVAISNYFQFECGVWFQLDLPQNRINSSSICSFTENGIGDLQCISMENSELFS